jgi:anti-anti-sigma factor
MKTPTLTIMDASSSETLLLRLSGSLASTTVPELKQRVESVDLAPILQVVLDLREVSYLDSQGLNLLVSLHRKFTDQDISFRLINVNDAVLVVFQVSNLVNLLEIGPPPETEAGLIRRHREALWQSHAFTNQLLAALGEAVLGLDLEGRVLFANPAAEKVLGWDESDLLGRYLHERIPTRDSDGNPLQITGLLRTNGAISSPPVRRYDLTLVNKDGHELEVEIVATTIFQAGSKMGTVLGIRDLTGTKRAHAELRRLATAVDQVAESIIIANVDGTIEYVNPAFERMTGYSRDEATGNSPKILKSGHHSKSYYRNLWQTITEGNVWSGRLTNRRRDGSLFEAEATISPVFDNAGNIMTYVSVMRDITQEVAMERQLQESQKLEAIAQLAGGIAHDFNNLLTTVMGNLGMARRRCTPEVRAFLEKAEKACLRGASLIDKMMLYSRKSEPEILQVNLNTVIHEVLDLARQTIDRRIEIDFAPDSEVATVDADPGQIHQVLLNLVLNARDAILEKIGRIAETGEAHDGNPWRIQAAVKCLSLESGDNDLPVEMPAGTYARVSVSDNGAGIDPAIQNRLFEPFFTTKEAGSGTGLGLASVYGIVVAHRGWISVSSELGVGTTFEFHLPISVQPTPPAPRPLTWDDAPKGTETILIVDDEEGIRDIAKATLENLGYQVLLAGDGEEGWSLFQQKHEEIDLVVLDLSLPKLSGQEVLEKIKSLQPSARVLICSGYHPQDIRSVSVDSEWAYLRKPYRATELATQVRAAMD